MNSAIQKLKTKFKRDGFVYQACRSIYMAPKLLFTKYGYIHNYLCLPIIGFMRTNHIRPFYDYNTKEIEKLRNIWKGKRCFIVATGPSLTVDDLNRLENELTIGVNSLYRLFDKTSFRPTYYMVLDHDVQQNVAIHLHDFELFAKEKVLFNDISKCQDKSVRYLNMNYQNHWYNVYNPAFDLSKNLRYTNNLIEGIFDKYTITNAAIDFAIFLGCKEIYLIGVDCNYTGPKIYFDDSNETTEEGREKGYYTQKAMMTGYRFMEKETKKRGIHVFNATRGGMLEEFDRVDFDSLFDNNGGQTK